MPEEQTGNEYAFWRAALALAGDGGRLTRRQAAEIGPLTSAPECGFWRKRVKGTINGKRVRRPSLPVAIWSTSEGFQCLVDGKPADASAIWSWVCTTPISEQTYRAVAERREWWPEGTDR